jgi:hypothetical protein
MRPRKLLVDDIRHVEPKLSRRSLAAAGEHGDASADK